MKFFGLICLLSLSLSAWGQDLTFSKAKLEARCVFGDVIRSGAPSQIVVDVAVRSAFNEETSIEVGSRRDELLSRAVVKLKTGLQRYTLPVVKTQYSQRVGLLVDERTEVSTELKASLASQQDYLALVLSPRKADFAYLGGYKDLLQKGEFRINQPDKGSELPDLWWTYLGHNLIVIHDLPALKLSDRTESALIDYVQAGGQLVLVSNLDPQELRGSRLAQMAPLQPSSNAAGHLLGRVSAGAKVLLKEQGRPLLLRRDYGSGCIWQLTAEVVTQDVLGTKKTKDLWQKIVSYPSGLDLEQDQYGHQTHLNVVPELPAIASIALVLYISAYVLLVIPAIYIYLRRKDRMLWLIPVVPLTSLLIFSLAYAVNYAGRTKEIVVRELGIAWASSDKTQVLLQQQAVFFSPVALKYVLDFPSDTLMVPQLRVRKEQSPVLNCQGESLSLQTDKLRQWGVSRWSGLGIRNLSGPISWKLNKSAQTFHLDITNSSDLPACQAVLLNSTNRCSEPFEIKPGRQVVDLYKDLDLQQELQGGALGPLSPDDATSLSPEIFGKNQSRSALILKVDDARFSVMHLRGLQPKVFRTTYLVITE